MESTIRRRLTHLRERHSVSQEVLSEALGFNNRQTLSDLESGKRNINASDIANAAKFFKVSIEYFTDPFELAGEARFSWRKSLNSNLDEIESFQIRAGRWITAYRHLSRLKGESVNSSLTQIELDKNSSHDDASSEGDAVSRALDLGIVPASKLASVLENRHDILVLYIDAATDISGAACQLGPLNTIIINRNEPENRRYFDMAHEFFHLITWDKMPPEHIEDNSNYQNNKKNKVEQLADMFAAGLLIPEHVVLNRIRQFNFPREIKDIAEWIKSFSATLKVSGQALKWRLVTLGYLTPAIAMKISDNELKIELSRDGQEVPPRFSHRFVETLGWGIENGHLSVRKAAEVIGLTIDELADLFVEHGLKTPFDL